MKPRGLHLEEVSEGLRARFRIAYTGELPNAKAAKKMALEYIDYCRERIEAGECINVGRQDDFSERPLLHRYDWFVERPLIHSCDFLVEKGENES